MIRTAVLWLAVAVLTFASPPLSATVIFQDDFNAENGGVGVLNYAGLANWTVSNGSVDLIGNSFNDLYPGNGLYLDLDGTTFDAATLASSLIALPVGSYQLEFDLGFNTVTGVGGNSMLVTLGTVYSETFTNTDAGTPALNNILRTFSVATAGSGTLVYDHTGGDNGGLIIDNVRLTLVPEPHAMGVLGCLVFAYLRRVRSS